MLHALKHAVDRAHADDEVRLVLLKGAGDKSFSTGANLKEFNALEGKEIERWILLGHEIFDQLESLPKPTVAYIQGYAMGGGLELALCCDFRLANNFALLSFPEVSHGWLPGWGGIPRLTRLIGEAGAKRLILLSQRIDAGEALRLGVLTKVLNGNDWEEQLSSFIVTLLSIDLGAYGLAKSAIQRSASGQPTDAHFDVLGTYFSKN